MEEYYTGDQTLCDCEQYGRSRPACHNCEQAIVCSQSYVAECEARLFCEVTRKLGYQITCARCPRELERLITLANEFLAASAHKEAEIVKFLTGRRVAQDESPM